MLTAEYESQNSNVDRKKEAKESSKSFYKNHRTLASALSDVTMKMYTFEDEAEKKKTTTSICASATHTKVR